MKKVVFLAAMLLLLWSTNSNAEYGRPMIHTYWHEIQNGPKWLFKPLSISIAGADGHKIYTFGSDKENHNSIFFSDDFGLVWPETHIDLYPANSISASEQDPQKAYYTSQGVNIFYSSDGGAIWTASPNPPTNLNFNICAANPHNSAIALTGCGESESEATAQKTTDYGQHWAGIQVGSNYPVLDIGWSPVTNHNAIASDA